MHPRTCVSGISTWSWSLDQDLAFYAAEGVHTIGVALRKLEADGIDASVARLRDSGLRVANVIGIGPFRLDQPPRWDAQRDRFRLAVDIASRLEAGCLVLTSGPAGGLPWEAAADALEEALTPVLPEARRRRVRVALEHTNSLRVDVGFVHSLRDAVDLANRLGIDVCMEVNACWAERGLHETIDAGANRLALVQVSDFSVGTLRTPDRAVPGDGDIPLHRILGQVLAAGYDGVFDLELVGPRIEEEGYERAVPRSIAALDALLSDLGA